MKAAADEAAVLDGLKRISEQERDTNRHPWLGVFLNCFAFSGAGYFYCRRYLRAGVAILMAMTIYATLYGLVFVESISFNLLLLIAVLGSCGLKTMISFDTFRIIRRQNTIEFEVLRKSQKDAWLAVVLAIVWPGLGLLYIRKWIYFILYLAVILFGWDKLSEQFMHDLPENYDRVRELFLNIFIIGAVATLCFRFLVKATGSVYTMRNFYRYGILTVTVWCICFLILLAFVKNILQVYNVTSGSMEPTIFTNESVIADKLAYVYKKPVPGDMVLFQREGVNVPWVKRVIAIEGQKVNVTDEGKLLVDGQEVSYDLILYENDFNGFTVVYTYDNIIVSKGSYYVVGDNYSNSYDSRHFGPIHEEEIIGKVVRVFDFGW